MKFRVQFQNWFQIQKLSVKTREILLGLFFRKYCVAVDVEGEKWCWGPDVPTVPVSRGDISDWFSPVDQELLKDWDIIASPAVV